MRQVFVYEYLSGGGPVGDEAGADALMPQGLAMRDALVADLLRSGDCDVTVATCARAGGTPAGAAEVAASDGETPQHFVARQAQRHDAVWVIAPESDGCLAGFEHVVGAPRWLGCDAHSIAIASSKGATLEHLSARGVATPLSAVEHQAGQRWVVKPDDGAGAMNTRVHAGLALAQADAQARRDTGVATWLEPWIEGEPLSLSLLSELGQAELLSVNRQRITVAGDGVLAYRGVEIDVIPPADRRRSALAALAARVAAALPGLRGFVGVDVVWSERHGPVVIEVNPRLTCSYVGLSQRLGRCIAGEVLALQRLEHVHA